MAALMRRKDCHFVEAHQCMLGLMLPGPDGVWRPGRKATGFLTNSPHIAAQLAVKCDGGHVHNTIQGRWASRCSVYPAELCRAICRGLENHLLYDKVAQLEASGRAEAGVSEEIGAL